MGDITLVFKFGEVVDIKVDFALIVIDQERHHIINMDEALKLGLFIHCQSNLVEVILVN